MANQALDILNPENDLSNDFDQEFEIQDLAVTSEEVVAEKTGIEIKEIKSGHGLLQAILRNVSKNQYTQAKSELEAYINSKPEFPEFKWRTERHMNYAIDIINAIKTKREFLGVASLRSAKQKELQDKIFAHYKELKRILANIERIDRDIKLKDLRSTIFFVKSCSIYGAAILIVLLILDLTNGSLANMWMNVKILMSDWVNLVLSTLGVT